MNFISLPWIWGTKNFQLLWEMPGFGWQINSQLWSTLIQEPLDKHHQPNENPG